ncbi:large ribosomal subunit processing factor, putative [Babesia caballi]|uniref:Large ribosomal subunit processing factor, putative n=1 Tax=Babesia caballi TaxID=5871 RepID=A0AAV4M0U7_BABCB|nr:large ribosomal subunit processing factor, putative [Babesia caballi]
MPPFVAPVADDAVTKLQNLLQNILHSVGDIVVTFAPEKGREFQEECAKLGIDLPKQLQDPVADSNPASEPKAAEGAGEAAAGTPEQPTPGSIEDRVERLGQLHDHVMMAFKELPTPPPTKAELDRQLRLLDDEYSRTQDTLKQLTGELNAAYETLRKELNN